MAELYDASGTLLATVQTPLQQGITFVDEGEPVIYNGMEVYYKPTLQKYPASGKMIDPKTNLPMKYEVDCNGYKANSEIQYVSGQVIYNTKCEPITDCNGNAVAGGTVYKLNDEEECKPVMNQAQKILAVRGEETTETLTSSLFLYRFGSDYSASEKRAIQNLDTSPSKSTAWIKEGETVSLYPLTRVSFELIYEGNKACVYAYTDDPTIKWRVEREEPTTIEKVLDTIFIADTENKEIGIMTNVSPTVDSKGVKLNCVPAPFSAKPEPVVFGDIISKVCTDYDTSASHWHKPFTGIVIQCVEETMLNIFLPRTATYTDKQGVEHTLTSNTVFGKVQENLKNAIRALFALYVIFFGYKLMLGREVPKKEEWMWFGLRFALVVYFALGSGMVDLLPKMVNVSKSLSLIVMEAALGEVSPEVTAAQNAKAKLAEQIRAQQDLIAKKEAYIQTLISKSAVSDQNLIDMQAALEGLKDQLEAAEKLMRSTKVEMDAAKKAYDTEYASLVTAQAAYDKALAERNNLQAYNENYTKINLVSADFSSVSVPNGYVVVNNYNGWSSTFGSGFEILNYGGKNVIELDGYENSNMTQTVQAYNDVTYTLSFDYAMRAETPTRESNGIEVYVNGVLKGTYPEAADSNSFASKTISFGGLSNAKIEFRSAGTSESIGGILDNIKLSAGSLPKALSDSSIIANNNLLTAATNLCGNGGVCYGDVMGIAEGGTNPNSMLAAYKLALEGKTKEYLAAKKDYDELFNKVKAETVKLNTAIDDYNSTSAEDIGAANMELEVLKKKLEDLQKQFDEATENLSNLLSSNTGTKNGYNYCDFRFIDYDMPTMKLWDMIDCKFSKYIGIGDKADAPDSPQVLLVAVTAIISTVYGIPIFLFTLVFLIFVILLIIRVIHVYIMAFVGAVMLAYIAPLVIPAVLFNYTKDIFNRWFQQMMGCLIQPILMFAALAFLLAAMDTVIFGDNKNFVTVDGSPVNTKIASNKDSSKPAEEYSDCTLPDNTTEVKEDGTTVIHIGKMKPGSIGCIYQTIKFRPAENVASKWVTAQVHKVDLSTDNKDFYVFIGLLKLLLLCFIAHVLLGTMEEISGQLSQVMGAGSGGYATLSVTPVMTPASIMSKIGEVAGMAVDVPGKIYDAAKGAGKKATAARQGLKTLEQNLQKRQGLNSANRVAGRGAKALNAHEKMAKEANAGDKARHAHEANEKMMSQEAGDKEKSRIGSVRSDSTPYTNESPVKEGHKMLKPEAKTEKPGTTETNIPKPPTDSGGKKTTRRE
ncbi:MAG: hypothetical protein K0R98_1241 [Rickettsiaceae bacterium]|nr:hypothetical protein [Rickettsiaceae bacterium]